jgi:DNA-binding NarL/FixJ family response regulator
MNLLILSPNPLARLGLTALLANLAEVHLLADLSHPADLPLYLPQAEIILWDFTWEGDSALANLTALRANYEFPPILGLLPPDSELGAFQAAGLSGFLPQEASPDQLEAALHALMLGLAVFDPDLLPTFTPPPSSEAGPTADLTPREREVLNLVAQGLANKSIARQLSISDHTVKFHINALMSKLGAQSRTEAVVKASRLGLIIL